jgi:monofunctional biosynthetic peptidoglycan transglycosylase
VVVKRLILAVIAASLAGIVALAFAFPAPMLAPGPVIPAHSGIANDCFACHAPLRGAVAEVMDLDSDRSHGASTLTMQTVKNLFLWHNFSYLRKPVEVPLALFLDAVWSKRRIMETNLSTAEFGAGIFGAEAAARHYFGISAAALSPWQSALLAATLPNPVQRNPARPSAYLANYAENISARVRRGVAAGCIRSQQAGQ